LNQLQDGTIAKHSGGTSGQVVGVFNGCFYTDPTTQKPTFKNYYPASTNASDIVAYVIDAPETVFEMNTNLSFVVADLFQELFSNRYNREYCNWNFIRTIRRRKFWSSGNFCGSSN
jgi:hypothetical protein